MVYSASFIYAQEKTGDGFSLIRKQFIYSLFGFFLLWKISFVPPFIWNRIAFPLLVLSTLLVGLTFVPGVGIKAGGARRWISLLGIHGQPAELAKFSLLLFVAHLLGQNKVWNWLHGIWLAPCALFVLLLLQPDFGSVALLTLAIGCLIFLNGIPWKKGLFVFLGGVFSLALIMIATPYRRHRVLAFLDPWQDPAGKGFQVIQSFIGLHHGRFFGVGLGNGKEKLFYLPEAHNDFIFSVIGEELGFLGTGSLILVYFLLIYRGFKIASEAYLRTQERFSFFFAVGITLAIGLQGFMNMAVVLGLVPTKGLTLPLISYGGSALLVDLMALGILLGISRDGKIKKEL